MHRLPLLFVTAVLETTAVSLFLLELGVLNLSWWLLLAVLVLGALVAWQAGRVPASRERIFLAVAGLVVALGAVAVRVGGLGVALAALVPGAHSQLFATEYGTLLVALFVFWRGGSLPTHNAVSVARTFSAGVFVSILGLLAAPLTGSLLSPVRVGLITMQLVVLVGAGLLAQALARAEEDNEGGAQRLNWRWFATLGAAVGLVALLGLVASGLFGGPAAALLSGAWTVVIFAIAMILLPLVWLLAVVGNWLISLLTPLTGSGRPLLTLPTVPFVPNQPQRPLPGVPGWATTGLESLLVLLPVVVLVLLILFMRRRRQQDHEHEERESLLSWSALGDDLRGLLRGLHNPFARPLEGLRAALAALVGGDPDSRTRRAYVRLLLALEARKEPRPASSTPAEYAPQAQRVLPETDRSVATLTAAYERARYAPGSLSPEAAAAAEQAWNDLEGRAREQRKA